MWNQGHALAVTINKTPKKQLKKMMSIIWKQASMKIFIERDYKKSSCSREFVNRGNKNYSKKRSKDVFSVPNFKRIL